MFVQFYVYISKHMYVMMSLYAQKYTCVCIYTHMYTRHVVERSQVRVPPGVSYFQKILIVSRKPSTVESRCSFPCVVSISYFNLYKQIYIYAFMIFSFFVFNYTFSLHGRISFNVMLP